MFSVLKILFSVLKIIISENQYWKYFFHNIFSTENIIILFSVLKISFSLLKMFSAQSSDLGRAQRWMSYVRIYVLKYDWSLCCPWRLKILGDDAFGKVSAWCKVGAYIINHLIEKKSVLSRWSCSRSFTMLVISWWWWPGLGVLPIALTSGSSFGAEMLFKTSLHGVKSLIDSQAYLKNHQKQI